MAYPTLAVIKGELNIQDSYTTDDARLAIMLSGAIDYVEAYCGRSFNSTNATRQFATDDVLLANGNLHLREEFLQLEELYVNGVTYEYIDEPAKYILLSANSQPPYNGVALGFTLPRPTNGFIGVRAEFGYCRVTDIPLSVYQAMIRLVVHQYRQSQSGLRGAELDRRRATVGTADGVPADVQIMLNQYRRLW